MRLYEVVNDLKFTFYILIILGFIAWISDIEGEITKRVAAWNESKARIERLLNP